MRVNTTEVATYFGPPASPLFGVLHLPKGSQIRGGVIICGSLGKEGMDSVRLQRPLADGLADRGFAVLRFDYLGTGDSAFTQGRDDAVDNWRRSIEHALEYINEIGVESVTAIGLRAGTLILSDFLAKSPCVDRVVYLDPVGTGRRYLREQTALATLSVGADSATVGMVSIAGARLSALAAKEFSALSLVTDPPAGIDHLLVLRTGQSDAKVNTLAQAHRVRSVTVDGLTEFAQIQETLTPLPLPAIDTMIDWVDEAESPIRTTATPRYVTSVNMPAEGPSQACAVVESIENIGPDGLFAIRTRPEHTAPGEGKVVLFHGTAYDLHIGPMREWVELSRRVTASGAQALRFDQSGIGNSGPVSREQWRPVFSRRGIVGALAAAEHAAKDPLNMLSVGVCSGAWHAAHAARATGTGTVILVNSIPWNWRTASVFLWQWDVKKSLRSATHSGPRTNSKVEGWRKRAIVSMKPARRTLQKRVHRITPRFVLMLLWRLGFAQVPEAILAELNRNGTATTVILCPRDAELFKNKCGYSGLKRLERASMTPKLVTPPAGDHPAYHQVMLEAIREAVTETLTKPELDSNPRTNRQELSNNHGSELGLIP